jgi:hypothetical protein
MKPTWTDREALQVYKRVTGDNPWNSDRNVFDRKTMARSIWKVVDAKNIKEAVKEILGWWGYGKEETTVRQIRKAYKEWRKLHRKVTPVVQLSLSSAYAKYRSDNPGIFNWRNRHRLKDAFESGWKAAMKTTHRRNG